MNAKTRSFRSAAGIVLSIALVISTIFTVMPAQANGAETYPDFSQFLTSVTLNVKNKEGATVQTVTLDKDSAQETIPPLKIEDGTTVSVSMDYALADIDQVTDSGDHVAGKTYSMQLPSALTITKNYSGTFTNGLGDWSVDTAGTVLVNFNSDADNYDQRGGIFEASSTFSADKVEKGSNPSIPFHIGGQTVNLPIEITAPQVSPTLTKSGKYNSDGTITWTVNVSSGNDGYNHGLTDVTVNDTFSDNQTFQSTPAPTWDGATVKDSDAAPETPYYVPDGQAVTFHLGDMANNQTKTLTYTTKAQSSGDKPVFPSKAVQYANDAVLGADEITSDPPAAKVSVSNTNTAISSWITKSSGTPVKDSGLLTSIPWTVSVGSDNGVIPAGAVVTDTLPKYLTLDGDVSLDGTALGTDSGADVYYSASTDGNGIQTVKVYFNSEIAAAKSLTFSTAVDPAYYQTNNGAFSNTATVAQGGSSANSTAPGVGPGSSVIAKNGISYDPATHLATWQVTVDSNQIAMPNPVVTDTTGAHQLFSSITAEQGGTPVTLTKAGSSGGMSANQYFVSSDQTQVIVHLKDFAAGDKPVVLTLTTEVTDPNYYGVNNTQTVSNQADLSTGDPGISGSSTATLPVPSEVIYKSAAGYNYADKTIQWNLRVNHNGMPMQDVVVHDTLPDGLTLTGVNFQNNDSIHAGPAGSGAPYYTLSGQDLEIHLGGISQEENLVLTTQVSDDYLSGKNTNVNISNTATLTTSSYTAANTPSSTASQNISHSIIEKSGSYDSTQNLLSWTVRINKNQIPAANLGIGADTKVTLTDIFQDGLEFDPVSVHLYSLTGSGGTWAKGAEIPLTPADAIQYDPQTRTFVFTFPAGTDFSKAYELDFSTDVLKGGNYTNSISMDGVKDSPSGTSGQFSISDSQVNGTFSGLKRGKVSLTKVSSETGEAIPGTAFTLYLEGFPLQTATTDSAGEASFSNLRQGVSYTIKETAPAPGYQNNSTPWTFTLDSQNYLTLEQTFKDSPIGSSSSSSTPGSSPSSTPGSSPSSTPGSSPSSTPGSSPSSTPGSSSGGSTGGHSGGGHSGGGGSVSSITSSTPSSSDTGSSSSSTPSSETTNSSSGSTVSGNGGAAGSAGGTTGLGNGNSKTSGTGLTEGSGSDSGTHNMKTGDSRIYLPLVLAGMLAAAVLFLLNLSAARRRKKR